jgi:hypothetical protein
MYRRVRKLSEGRGTVKENALFVEGRDQGER